MIIGLLHPGSGLGDQLFSYIATRVRARELGTTFGFIGVEYFKGHSFMKLNFGMPVSMSHHIEYPAGKIIIDDIHDLFEINTPSFNPEFDFIPNGTVIDGYGAQDIKYFERYLTEIREWLAVDSLDMPDNLCVINFRGGEFASVPDLFLKKDYWDKAIKIIKDHYLDRLTSPLFEVHTDDPALAKQFFPDYKIIQDIGLNWRSVRHAKYVILSNSAFGIIPSLLNEKASKIIAPRYWARRNTKQWSLPANYYRKFEYI